MKDEREDETASKLPVEEARVRKPFVEPEVSPPRDVLEATTSLLFSASGGPVAGSGSGL